MLWYAIKGNGVSAVYINGRVLSVRQQYQHNKQAKQLSVRQHYKQNKDAKKLSVKQYERNKDTILVMRKLHYQQIRSAQRFTVRK